jgi:Rrf2 family protein
MHDEGTPQRVTDIAGRTGITVPFIEQIIKPLKHAGMVVSRRGAAGGHRLGRPAEAITLGDIVRVMEGSVELAACLSSPEICERTAACPTMAAWKRVTDAMLRELDTIALAELTRGAPDCRQFVEAPVAR